MTQQEQRHFDAIASAVRAALADQGNREKMNAMHRAIIGAGFTLTDEQVQQAQRAGMK